MADFQLNIYTQEKQVFDGMATSVVAPGADGYFGVLANHAPLLAALGRGALTVRTGSQQQVFKVSGGFLEVHGNQATVLADSLDEVDS